MEQNKTWYYLCSEEVVNAFPELVRSKPFKSGYESNNNNYYVIVTQDPEALTEYYQTSIFTVDNQDNPIDFWFRLICDSQVKDAKYGSLARCIQVGIFCAIEELYGLTTETNVAFCIYKLAELYDLTPLEFVNRVTKIVNRVAKKQLSKDNYAKLDKMIGTLNEHKASLEKESQRLIDEHDRKGNQVTYWNGYNLGFYKGRILEIETTISDLQKIKFDNDNSK